jgi:hypothetical protein
MASFMKHIKEYDSRFSFEKVKRINGSESSSSGIMKVDENDKDKKDLDGVIIGFKSVASWYENLEKVKKYIDENGKRPIGITALGGWIGTQNKNYKKQKHIMSDKNIFNIWNLFIKSEKYEIYFKTDEEKWNYNYNLLLEYLLIFNKKPNIDDKDKNISKIGKWLGTQLFNFKNYIGLMKRKHLYDKFNILLTNYKNCFITDDEKWIVKLNQLKEFLNKHKKRPTPETDKNLCYWLTDQIRRVDFENYTIRNELWLELINDIKYKVYFDIDNIKEWFKNLEKLKLYIDKNNSLPNINDDTQIQLYNWIETQEKKYKNKSKIMKNKDIYEAWTNLIVNSKYSKYFKNNIDEWKDILTKIKKYIDTNNKIPNRNSKINEIKILGYWLDTQKYNYRKQQKIMKNTEIYNLFKQFLLEYSKYFMSKSEYWINNLNLVKKYINENNKRPFSNNSNKNIASLGNWLQFQIKNYKNQKGMILKTEIKKLWCDFINDNKYKQYFD